jgi:hypothetical protein
MPNLGAPEAIIILLVLVMIFGIPAAVIIAVVRSRRARERSMQVIATFAPDSARRGQTIAYDAKGFVILRDRRTTAQEVHEFGEAGSLVWAHDGMRQWVAQMAGHA